VIDDAMAAAVFFQPYTLAPAHTYRIVATVDNANTTTNSTTTTPTTDDPPLNGNGTDTPSTISYLVTAASQPLRPFVIGGRRVTVPENQSFVLNGSLTVDPDVPPPGEAPTPTPPWLVNATLGNSTIVYVWTCARFADDAADDAEPSLPCLYANGTALPQPLTGPSVVVEPLAVARYTFNLTVGTFRRDNAL
jgi:hypothetical protein